MPHALRHAATRRGIHRWQGCDPNCSKRACKKSFGTASNLSRRQRRSAAPAERGWRCADGAPAGCSFVAAPCRLLFARRRSSARRAAIAPSNDTDAWQVAARMRSSSNGAACISAPGSAPAAAACLGGIAAAASTAAAAAHIARATVSAERLCRAAREGLANESDGRT